jgi:hypothetical protein
MEASDGGQADQSLLSDQKLGEEFLRDTSGTLWFSRLG